MTDAITLTVYKWSWTTSDPYQGPLDTNVGVTFTGWVASPATASSANIRPVTTAPIKWLCYGVSIGSEQRCRRKKI